MQYTLSYQYPQQQFLDISLKITGLSGEDFVTLQLPAWRPGRYELGNFAKNIQRFGVRDEKGNALRFEKVSKDGWIVQCKNAKSITVDYNYYAAELNAGSTWLDENMLYVNPVNCFIYRPDHMEEPATVQLKVPRNYEVATGMTRKKKHTLHAANVQQLMDCPFIASAGLQHDTYKVGKVTFHLWFAGECKPDWKRLKKDFSDFTKAQIEAFGDFPVAEYHFLNIAQPGKVYHGVEHSNSTVISLGPGYDIFNPAGRYTDLLAVSSHELYHTWNIKAIRPDEMLPYDFTKENYSRLGYVAEGVTTYMGDLMLVRSGGFSQNQFLLELSTFAQRHYDNFGRENLSVAESSFDTWLDGYSKGIPNRKVSIYTEGALNAIMCDLLIRKHTKNKHSLDDVMRDLYQEYAKNGLGYTEEIYRGLIEKYSGKSFKRYFEQYIHGTVPIEKELKQCLSYVGLELVHAPSSAYREHALGLKAEWGAPARYLVTDIHPGAPAEKAGLVVGDELLYINNFRMDQNLNQWLEYFGGKVTIQYKRNGSLRETEIWPDGNTWYKQYTVRKMSKPTASQKRNYSEWTGCKF